MIPTPRQLVYQTYWRFAAERLSIMYARLRGQSAPWTKDPILQRFKFCNTYRVADRESQFLLRDIIYSPSASLVSVADLLFQITAFRFFSCADTWRTLCLVLGRAPLIVDLYDDTLLQALRLVHRSNGKLYTGAFILCANNAYGFSTKVQNHCALWRQMFYTDHLADQILSATSFQQVILLLQAYPLIGPFMAYQIAVDLNYSPYLNFSENDYTQPGPGALRGLKKVFTSLGSYTPTDVIHWMVDRQQTEFERLELDFPGLYGRPLQAIDAQGLFCEVDKYARVAFPQLSSARRRIKSTYSATSAASLLPLVLPPKWGTLSL